MSEYKKVWAIVDYDDCHGGYPSQMSFHLEKPDLSDRGEFPVHFALYEGWADSGEFAVIVRQDITDSDIADQIVEQYLGEDWLAYEPDFIAARAFMATGQGKLPHDVVTLMSRCLVQVDEDGNDVDIDRFDVYQAFVRVMVRNLADHEEVTREMAQDDIEHNDPLLDILEDDDDHGQIILEDEGEPI